MLALNYRDSQPLYSQIRDGLRRLILSGALEPGEELPTVRAMAMDLAVNPKAIQRAYSELESEGFIHTAPGEGSFIRGADSAAQPGLQRRTDLLEQLQALLAELRAMGVSGEELLEAVREGGRK